MNSPSARNRERILEAIDQLRKRKARPDIQRICSYLFRRFHVNSVEAKADLDWCVANSIVLKVEYKGSISYRNAAKKWAQMRHRESQGSSNNPNVMNKLAASKNFMEMLTNVFGELVVDEPDYLEMGVPPREIIENILSKDSVRYTRNYIAILLIKEVERGNLIKLENGNFLLGPCADDRRQEWITKENEEKIMPSVHHQEVQTRHSHNQHTSHRAESSNAHVQTDAEVDREKHVAIVKPKKRMIAKVQAAAQRQEKLERQENMDSADEKRSETRSETGHVRLGGRRKKAKKVFDPSDTHVPKKRGRPAGSLNKTTIEKHSSKRDEEPRPDSRTSTGSREQGGVCSVCHTQSKRGPHDRMVGCRECSNKAHYSCLNGDDMMLRMYPDNTWQCPHCKTCVICYETSDADQGFDFWHSGRTSRDRSKGNLIVCSVCADGYHAGCHEPRITDKIKNGQRWLCVNCQVTDEMKINDIQSNIGESISHKLTSYGDKENDKEIASQSNSVSGQSSPYDSPQMSPSPPVLSPQPKNRSETPDRDVQSDSNSTKDSEPEDPNIDPSIPDATHWTPDEVYQYFAQFFPEEAKVFKEQEIDGRSLLLLKRMDVLTNLNLKLGPALKIYRHVTMLQVRRDDRSLYWL